MLQCDPFYADWSQFGTVDVFHEGIIPEGVYHLQVVEEVCSVSVEGNFSAVLEVMGPKWGDTISDFTEDPPGAPNGTVDIIDALAVVDRFGNKPGSIVKTRADVEPACVDIVINITDVLQALKGFQGLDYSFEPSALNPCDSTCENPLP